MKNLTILILLVLGSFNLKAQQLGEFKPEVKAGQSKKAEAPNTVYIANFSVNYQLFNQMESNAKGGLINGKLLGKSSAALAVGLNNITEQNLQELTNTAYNDFVADLQAKGFTVLDGDKAANTSFYEGYTRLENQDMSLSEMPGAVTVYPENAVFFVEGFSADGQKKQGGVWGKLNKDPYLKRLDEVARYPKLSEELNQAYIVDVNLYVSFLTDQKKSKINGTRVSVETDLRLVADEHVSSITQNKSGLAKVGIASSKKEQTIQCVSLVDVVQGKNKIGGSPFSTYRGGLKKDLQIQQVIANEKLEANAAQDWDSHGIETAFGKLLRADNNTEYKIALIEANSDKYNTGVADALHTFLSYHAQEIGNKFMSN